MMVDRTTTALDTTASALPLLVASGFILLALSLLPIWLSSAQAGNLFDAPVDVSGDFGYSYHSLDSAQGSSSFSHQFRSSVKARTWIWQPWLATVDMGLRGTFDSSETARSGVSTGNTATILTGDLNLGILSQSRTPLQISYRASDSRVESLTGNNPLTGLGGREFSTNRLAIKQRYFTPAGHRFQFSYDKNQWQSGGERYDDSRFGGDISVRLPQHTLALKVSSQESDYSLLAQTTRTQVLNVDHFYYPGQALRVDSMANLYRYERSSQQPLINADSKTDLAQLSSTVFWRPQDRPITISAGVRLYDLEGVTAGNSVEALNISATTGMFYQWSKNLRLDANIDMSRSDNNGNQVNASRQRLAALYQTDIFALFGGANWQGYSTVASQLRNANSDLSGTIDVSVGHDVRQVWMLANKQSWRLSFSQSGVAHRLSDNGVNADTGRLNHSGSLSWDFHGGAGMAMVQLTLSDSRQIGGAENNQQLINFQLLGNLNIDRLRSFNGNFTLQNVRRDYNEAGNNDTVTTATGQISYKHSSILGIPRLRFVSDLRLSMVASDDKVDRGEWENRLDYAIGLLDARVSWRRTVLSSDNDFDLVYMQLTRRF